MTTPWTVQLWPEAAPEDGLMFSLEGGKYLEIYRLRYAEKDFLAKSKEPDIKSWFATGQTDPDNDDFYVYRKYSGSVEKADLLDFAETLAALVRRIPS